MRSPRQPGWGWVITLSATAAIVLFLRIRASRETQPPSQPEERLAAQDPAQGSRRHSVKPRGLFAPFGPARKASSARIEPAGAVEAQAQDEVPREFLSGRVLAPDGSPVEGASVTLGQRFATTGPDGRYSVPRGSGRLRVSHPDFFPREADADGAASMSLVVVPGARIAGIVVDATGRPAARAKVQFGTGENPPAVATGMDGAYESPLLPPAPVCVLVTHPDFQPESRVVAPRAGGKADPGSSTGNRARCDVQLSPGDKLAVHAQSREGDPVPDAEVWIQNEERRTGAEASVESSAEWRFLGRTDDLGRLETRKAPGTQAVVRLSLAGFRDEMSTVSEKGGAEVSIVMRAAPALRGQAVDALSGLPARIGSLRLEMEQGLGHVEAPHRGILFESLEPGKLVVGLPPQEGTYRVLVTSRSSSADARRLEGASEPIRFDGSSPPPPFIVRLSERLELEGVVSVPKGSLEEVTIELLADAPPESLLGEMEDGPQRFIEVAGVRVPAPFRLVSEAKTAAHGRFSFKGLSHGTYRLHVKPCAGRLAEFLSAPFAVPWDGEFPVTLHEGAEVLGTLLSADGRPEPGTTVILIRGDEWAKVSTSNADGKFRFESLGPGSDYRLVVARGGARAEDEVVSRNLTLEEGKDLAYDVRRPAPAPEPEPEQGPDKAVDFARDDSGIVKALARESEVPSAPAETASPADDAADGLPAGASPTPEPEEPSAQVRYQLHLVNGETRKPFEKRAEVEMSDPEGKTTWTGASRDGAFEARGMPPGKYTLRVRTRNLLVHAEEIDIQRDLEQTVAIDEPHEVSVRLVSKDGEPLQGEATIVLSKDGAELYRSVDVIDGKVTVPTPGAGEYELLVESGNYVARMRVKVTREND